MREAGALATVLSSLRHFARLTEPDGALPIDVALIHVSPPGPGRRAGIAVGMTPSPRQPGTCSTDSIRRSVHRAEVWQRSTGVEQVRQRTLSIGDIDLTGTLRTLLMLSGDPTVRLTDGRFERATLTPDGPGSIRADWGDDPSTARLSAWGPGGSWLLERAEGLLGLEDRIDGFDPADKPLRDVWRRQQQRRLFRTRTLWHDLAWLIVQQRVTRVDAGRQWTRFVTASGADAPGPVELLTPPTPAATAALHYTDFHRFGIERQRAEYLRAAARIGDRLAGSVDGPFDEVRPKLAAIRGLGPWTMSSVASHTWGDADSVVVGDDGIPSMVTWFLAGEARGDDERMLELLEPYRPHRARVVQMVFASGVRPPRRHHRYARNPIQNR